MPKIISTLTAAVSYSAKIRGDNGMQTVVKTVVVNGGHGTVGKHGEALIGAETLVSDDELEVCKRDSVFRIHMKNGYVKVVQDEDVPAEKVVADMTGADRSAPMTPETGDQKTPVVSVGGSPRKKK